MKNLLFLLTTALILSSCQLVEDVQTSYNNVVEEGKAVIENIQKTKETVEEKIDKIETAINEIKGAADAISSISE
ncbi:MAG: hypothetical protein V1679_01705 [Candidatus Peregrinibacteria bacterium]